MTKYALSTSWNVDRHDDGKALIQEILDAGFHHIEAEYRLTTSMLTDIVALHKQNAITIASLHNYCPVPDILKPDQGSGDAFMLSSLDEDERQLAIKYSKKTIELAHDLDGVPVVFHTGHFDIKGQSREFNTSNLVKLIKEDKPDETAKLRLQLKEQRDTHVTPYFDELLHSLDALNEFAYRYEVKLGIENRYFYFDIPDFEEMSVILNEFEGGNIYYWHDVGHAQMFEFLGLKNHQDFLDTYNNKLIGIHLHDMVDDHDHQAPGKGSIDFRMVSKYLKPETVRVLEVHPPDTAEDLKAGVEVLQSVGV